MLRIYECIVLIISVFCVKKCINVIECIAFKTSVFYVKNAYNSMNCIDYIRILCAECMNVCYSM